jgi:methyltransferase
LIPAILLLSAVTLERLGELWLARRNTAALLANGAYEAAPEHYPLIVALHALWLAGLWGLGWAAPLRPGWVAVFLVSQAGRIWVLSTLGRRWTTRIIVVPGAPLVASGPYRFVTHPNYLVVIGEIAVLPLCFGLPWYALAFSLANLAVLWVRVRAENATFGVAAAASGDPARDPAGEIEHL